MNRIDAKSTRRNKIAGVGQSGEVHRGVTVAGDFEWSMVTAPPQFVQPPKCGA